MNYQQLRIVFMGTPDFAVASLEALLQAGCNVIAVVTAPDKPAGRGMKIQQSAVKQYADEKGIVTLQPEKLKSESFIHSLQLLHADIQIVVAFRMLPEVVWSMPPLGTINVHASLLPQYRGAAPINWAIIHGEKETGVTTFKLQQAIDTGDILLQEKITIDENENVGEVYDKLKIIGASILVKTVQQIAENTIMAMPQNADTTGGLATLHHAPKLFSADCIIHFNQSVDAVHNLVRGLSPYPGAYTFLNQKIFKIFATKKEETSTNEIAGTIVTDHKTFFKIACNNGYVHCLQIQLEGKKKMLIEDFLRGKPITATFVQSKATN